MMVATLLGAFSALMKRLASLTLGRKIASSKSKMTGGRRRMLRSRSTSAGPIGNISR
jgi:hypothetical protein